MGIFYLVIIVVAIFSILFVITKVLALRFSIFNTILVKLREYLIFSAPLQYVITGYFRIVSIFMGLLVFNIMMAN